MGKTKTKNINRGLDKTNQGEDNASGVSRDDLRGCDLSSVCSLLDSFQDDFEAVGHGRGRPSVRLEVDKEKLVEISQIRCLVDSLLNPDMND